MPHDVFISYSTQDKVIADALCARLEQQKLRCWIAPRDVLPGSVWGEAIIDAISNSRAMVVVFSSSSNTSPQVMREVERAVSKGLAIVPFRIEDVAMSKSLEYFLSTPHWLDAMTRPLEAHMDRLASVLQSLLECGDDTDRARPLPSSPVNVGGGPKIWARTYEHCKSALIWSRQTIWLAGLAGRTWLEKLTRKQQAIVGGCLAVILSGFVLWATLSKSDLQRDFADYERVVLAEGSSSLFFSERGPERRNAWLSAAEAGDPVAMLFVGRCFSAGIGGPINEQEAAKWYQRSADAGNDYAMWSLGISYRYGSDVVEKDPAKAENLFRRAAEAGNTRAMVSIGYMTENGEIGRPDPVAANEWYRRAADRGDADAMRILAINSEFGIGMERDVDQAKRWYKRAADAGHSSARGRIFAEDFLGPLVAYSTATEEAKPAHLDKMRKMLPAFQKLNLNAAIAVFSSDVNLQLVTLRNSSPSDPLVALSDEMVAHLTNLFEKAVVEQRVSVMNTYTEQMRPLVERWYGTGELNQVMNFFRGSLQKVLWTPSMTRLDGDQSALISLLRASAVSLIRYGHRDEGKKALARTLELCDAYIERQPWNFYLSDAYMGMCWEAAASLHEAGDEEEVQPLLRRAWTVALQRYGRESLLSQYTSLPLKGLAPPDATEADRDFFLNFGPKKKEDAAQMFHKLNIEIDFGGTQYPFHVYLFTGPRGYSILQDQFRWLKECRGGEVPAEMRANFDRLRAIAKENNVDFAELANYALSESKTDRK